MIRRNNYKSPSSILPKRPGSAQPAFVDCSLKPSPSLPLTAPISWTSLDEEPDYVNPEEHIWDGNKKLFVQLLDDMDNIGPCVGLGSDMSVKRRRKARELFTDWLFNPEVKKSESAVGLDPRRFSGDFTNFDVGLRKEDMVSKVENFDRMRAGRRSCGIIPEVQRRNLYSKWRPNSVHVTTEDEPDSGYHSGNSQLLSQMCKKSPGQMTLARDNLKKRIDQFNLTNTHGLLMEMPDKHNTFHGSIRVHMNLIRPIKMRVSKKPLSIYDSLSRRNKKKHLEESEEVSFTLPKNSSKVIHISSQTSTTDVIETLLSKFNISDSPRKFSLFEKCELPDVKVVMRRMGDEEKPLSMCLSWTNLDHYRFVLQENDAGEIQWEAFSLSELESFLNVLDREELECIDQVRTRYQALKTQLNKMQMVCGKKKKVPTATLR